MKLKVWLGAFLLSVSSLLFGVGIENIDTSDCNNSTNGITEEAGELNLAFFLPDIASNVAGISTDVSDCKIRFQIDTEPYNRITSVTVTAKGYTIFNYQGETRAFLDTSTNGLGTSESVLFLSEEVPGNTIIPWSLSDGVVSPSRNLKCGQDLFIQTRLFLQAKGLADHSLADITSNRLQIEINTASCL